MKRETMQNIVYWLFRNLTQSEFYGLENLPKSGPVIVATNHLSRLDIPLLFINPVRTEITGLITTKYLDYFWIKWIANTAHAIWIDRETADFSAFRNAVETIKNGTAVGIAPEGTRSTTGGLLEGKSGTVLLALRSKALIVPVGVTGTESGINKLLHFKKPRLVARFGPAFTLPELERGDRPAQLKNMTDEIMCRIAALLPDSYHGFYAGNPRIQELREQGAGLPS